MSIIALCSVVAMFTIRPLLNVPETPPPLMTYNAFVYKNPIFGQNFFASGALPPTADEALLTCLSQLEQQH